MEPLLELKQLKVGFRNKQRDIQAVHGVNLTIHKGEVLAVVGESGCGKSLTALAIMGLIGQNSMMTNTYIEGEMLLHTDQELISLSQLSNKQYEQVRGSLVSMIFQEPMTALNPLLTVGEQISEVLIKHKAVPRKQAKLMAIDLLEQVGIPEARNRYKSYPFQFSGGQKQRVMIAMAMACDPKLLIADEPTTALDVTIQSQILYLLKKIKEERHTSMMFITHNLGIVAQFADRVAVMYRGIVVEYATVKQLFAQPAHPYTKLLLGALPQKGQRSAKGHRLLAIHGTVPGAGEWIAGCPFHTRCPFVQERCMNELPNLTSLTGAHQVRCYLNEEEQSNELQAANYS